MRSRVNMFHCHPDNDAEPRIPNRCQTMDARSDSDVLAFMRHASILYNVGVIRSVLTTNCTVNPLRTPFGLVIPLIQSSTTRNYNHSQLFPTLCYLCTAYNHLSVREYNHLLHSYTFTLADFSAIDYFPKLSQTLHLHASRVCLLSRPHSPS
jgi:hypothetical protein